VRVCDADAGRECRTFRGHRGRVYDLAFAPDGRRLASASGDTTALVWDLGGLPGPAPAAPVTAGEADALWAALGGAEAAAARRAVLRLAASPPAALALLGERLKHLPAPDPAKVQRWLSDLDDDAFAVRSRAFEGLKNEGAAAGPALRRALAARPSPEARRHLEELVARLDGPSCPTPAALAAVRGVEVLERIGTPAARRLLEELARLTPGGPSAAEARAALRRPDATTRRPAH